MKELFSKLIQLLKDGKSAVMVTIVAGSGSTPGGAGTRMLVDKSGRLIGTIGGGAVEYRATDIAQQSLVEGKSGIKAFALHCNEVEDLGMICGGDVKVFFQVVTPSSTETVDQILSCYERDEDSWLITDLTDETNWRMGVYSQQVNYPAANGGAIHFTAFAECASGLARSAHCFAGIKLPFAMQYEVLSSLLQKDPVLQEYDNCIYYSEPLVLADKVIVFGGGHVAQELVPLLRRVGFRCTVFDDREEFASQAIFPDADQVVMGDFSRIREFVDIRARDYVVIMTRGHAWDYAVEEQVLRGETAYTGVIGSKIKIVATREKLRDAGISEEKLDLVHTPIGLPIKAKTPAEIAVSIAAEMSLVRATRTKTGRW